MLKLSAALLAGALCVSPVTAATFNTSVPGDTPASPGLLTIDFDNANALSDIPGLSGNGHIVQGFSSGIYAQPAGDTTKYLSVPQNNTSGAVTLDLTGYDFGGTVTGFNFYWGSIDTYNSLKVTTSLGVLNFAFDGGINVIPPADGNQTDYRNNRRVFFDLAQGEDLKSLEFISTNYAMEVDDLVFTGFRGGGVIPAAPEPGTWAMMMLGFGVIGAKLRSRGPKRVGKAALAWHNLKSARII